MVYQTPLCQAGMDIMQKRELFEPHKGDKRYVRRDDEGQFTSDQVDFGKSLSADRKRKSTTVAPKTQGNQKRG